MEAVDSIPLPVVEDAPAGEQQLDRAPINENAIVYPQVVVNQVYKFTKDGELEKLLESLDIPFKKVKKIPKKDFAFITFEEADHMNKCVDRLHGVMFRKNKLQVAVRDHVTNNRKRPRDPNESLESLTKRVKEGKDAVSPWWNVPYEEQLRLKQESMKKDCLGKMAAALIQANKIQGVPKKFMPSWLFDDALGLQYNEIIRSPEVVGYRNKCEFTFGKNVAGEDEVGFRVSSFDDGALIASPQNSPTVPNAMKIVARSLTEFVCSSQLASYNITAHSGVWRTVMLRYSKRTLQLTLMLVVSLHGDRETGSDAEKNVFSTFDSELVRLTNMLQALTRDNCTDDESSMYNMCNYSEDVPFDSHAPQDKLQETKPLVTGLCYQIFNGLSVPAADHPYTLVFGEPMLDEVLLGCNFQVSPQAFFQVNTRTAELLFSHVIKMIDAKFTPGADTESVSEAPTATIIAPYPASTQAEFHHISDTVCLDVCCGTGTIGICVAAHSSQRDPSATSRDHTVLGVDLCSSAIDDAWKNMERNGLTPLMNRVVLGGSIVTSSAQPSNSGSRGQAYFVPARAEALMEGILYKQGWRGCNGTGVEDKNALSIEEQRRLHAELSQLRTIVDGKRLLAIVDPPREVQNSTNGICTIL